MSNLFIIQNTNHMSDDDWVVMKKIDKADSIMFLVPGTGLIPYQALPHFYGLKKEPEIYPFADVEPMALSFFIGVKCSNIGTGKCYIITTNPKFEELDEFVFDFDKTSIEIKIMDNLEDAIKDKKGTRQKKSATTTVSDIEEQEIVESVDNMEDETIVNPVQAKETESQLSDEFIRLLQKYSSPTVNLLSHKDILAECVRNSSEGVLDTLGFQIKIQLGPDYVEKYLPLLEDHLEELQNSL